MTARGYNAASIELSSESSIESSIGSGWSFGAMRQGVMRHVASVLLSARLDTDTL